ncbi:hypothetical protein K7432_011606 [Basidiobolus ranarum]|uniref:Uncharacterized protein n=1 Tax=Basidiobolus ranarum TaxID=34480 RepID=A0ABR2VUB7_9FUNG
MRFVLALLVVLCAIFSIIAAPLPLNAVVNANAGSTSTPPTPGTCDDINAQINILTVKVTTVICLRREEQLPTAMVPTPSTQCSPDINASITALGLNIRAIVCLEDGIKVVATVQ